MKKPITLIIMDGFGLSDSVKGNAIKAAKTPNLDEIFKNYPTTKISASGLDVGLPDGQMGNSEVGHTNIGAGRVVYQDLVKISKDIESGAINKNEALIDAINKAKANNSAIHFMGLLSDGGVHSHYNHMFGLVKMAHEMGLDKIYIHAFMDGRDVSPTSGVGFMETTVKTLNEIGAGKVATICGRYYSMDRDFAWDRVFKAYDAMVNGNGILNSDPVKALKESYENGVTDEFVLPTVVDKEGMIKDGDSVVFYNFRPDRARQITRSIVDDDFDGFERAGGKKQVNFVCMTQYDALMPNVSVAYKPHDLKNTFGEYISKKGLTQLRIAETQKYAHVTFFFNGGVEAVCEGEDRALIPSPTVATFDMQPEMSAYGICDEAIKRIKSNKYDVIILNYANCDMVGHTGDMDATIKAVETVDTCVKRVADEVLNAGGVCIITADHGNADKLLDEDGNIFTAHTTNLVPFTIMGYDNVELKDGGRLADIAPTMLEIMGYEKPAEMDGQSLIK